MSVPSAILIEIRFTTMPVKSSATTEPKHRYTEQYKARGYSDRKAKDMAFAKAYLERNKRR